MRAMRNTTLGVFGGLVFCVIAVVAGLSFRLSQGPLSLDSVASHLTDAVERRLGGAFAVSVSSVVMEQTEHGPSIRLVGVRLSDRGGREVIASPKAEIGFDPLALMRGDVSVRRMAFIGPQLRVRIGYDAVEFEATDGSATQIPAAQRQVGAQVPSDAQVIGTPAPVDATGRPAPAEGTALAQLLSESGPAAALERVAVQNGRLVVEDKRVGVSVIYEDVRFDLTGANGDKKLSISARGSYGTFSAKGQVTAIADGGRRIQLEPQNVPLGDMLLPAISQVMALAPEALLSGRVTADIDQGGRFLRGDANLTLGPSRWLIPGDATPALSTDQLKLDVSADAATGTGAIRRAVIVAGGTRVQMTGTTTRAADGAWRIALDGAGSVVGPARPSDPATTLTALAVDLATTADFGRVTLERLKAVGPAINLDLTSAFATQEPGAGLKLDLAARDSTVAAVLAFWPEMVAPELRSYLVERFEAGRVQALSIALAFTPSDLADAIGKRPLPDSSVALSIAVQNATLRIVDGLPPMTGGVATATSTGRTARVQIESGTLALDGGRSLMLSDGDFTVADTSLKPPVGTVSFRVQGGADAFADLLSRDLFETYASIDIDPKSVKGVGDTRIKLTLPLADNLKADDLKVTLKGEMTGLTLMDIAGPEALEAAQASFSFDGRALTVNGTGRFLGVPATIDVRRPDLKQAAEARLSFTLDDAARTRKGFGSRELTGPVGVRVSTRGDGDANLELDLTRATIDGLLPGWRKPAGQAARATFKASQARDNIMLEDLRLTAGPVSMQGRAVLGKDGGLISARFDTFRLAAGDDVRLDVERAGGGFKATLRGSSIDARPLIRSVTSGASGAGGRDTGSKDAGKDMELEARINSATGFNGETINGLDLKLARRGGNLRQFSLAGRLGRGTISGSRARAEGDGEALLLETTDAGATLRFADLYRRMIGGTMSVRLGPDDQRQDGLVIVRDFRLRDEPAMARVASGSAASSQDRTDSNDRDGTSDSGAEVAFTRMRVEFQRAGSRFDVRDAVMWGPQIGATLSGIVDYGRDRIDMTGTFVPAYGLNNAFARVPVLGTILGGGSNEGLFAVSFRVSGSAATPTVAISPLSAIAPGIFRKLFEFRDSRSDALGPPGGTSRER